MVLASYTAGDPRASLVAARRATAERQAHPDAHVEYDPVDDTFTVVANDELGAAGQR